MSKLYVIGDSISKGCVQNLEPGKRYSVYEGNFWSNYTKSHNVELINKSAFGSTITKGYRQLKKDLDSGLNVDACVIEFGGNDSDYRWPELFEKGPDNFFPNTKLDDFIKTLAQMVDDLQNKCIIPILMTLPPLVGDKYFEVISNGLDRKALLDWMHDPWFLYREQELYSNAVAQFARENNVFLLDIRKEFLLRRDCQELMCEDGIHPNIKGHLFLTECVNKLLGDFSL